MDAVEDAWWFACLIPVRPDLFDWPREDARSWLAAEIEMAEHDQAEACLRSTLESPNPEPRAPTDPRADRRRRMST